MPSRDKLTIGEIANMRDRLRAARRAFGENVQGPEAVHFLNPGRPAASTIYLDHKERAVLDLIQIVDRLLE